METQKKGPTTTEIHNLLLDIGIPANLIGFQYITNAIQLAFVDEAYLCHVTKLLYIDIAKKYCAKPTSVERAIRHAISVAWTYGNKEEINRLFRHSINPTKGVPTNSQFLARLHFYLDNEITDKSA